MSHLRSCRFALSDIDERQVSAEEGYSIFEPTVALEIDGNNVFHSLGIEGAKITVVMPFRAHALNETLKMTKDVSGDSDSNRGIYEYWLSGTGFGIHLNREDHVLEVSLKAGNSGPTQGVSWPKTVHVATITVRKWVESIVSLSKQLSDMFRRLNPEAYHDPLFQKEEGRLLVLEKWLATVDSPSTIG